MTRSRTAIKYVMMVKYDVIFHSLGSSGGLVFIAHAANNLILYLTALHFKESKKDFSLFHETGLFLYPLKTSENLWFF